MELASQKRLAKALASGAVQDVSDAISLGADPNGRDRFGHSMLRMAVNHGDIEKILLLVDSGADVRVRDADGNSALSVAVVWRRVDIVKLLLARGGDPLSECNNGNMVAVAVLAASRDLVDVFARLGVDLNAFNPEGFTPLMLAAGNSVNDVIPVLLAHGAHLDLRDKNGMTAYLHAALIGNVIAGDLLRAAGADTMAQTFDGLDAVTIAAMEGHMWNVAQRRSKGDGGA